jgi:hypothetical protein
MEGPRSTRLRKRAKGRVARSQTSCGHKKDNLDLSEPTYHCEHRGLTIDRDLNAAVDLARWPALQTVQAAEKALVTAARPAAYKLGLHRRGGGKSRSPPVQSHFGGAGRWTGTGATRTANEHRRPARPAVKGSRCAT